MKAGKWKRAGGSHAETYEDLDLEADEEVLGYPLWSYDIPGDVAETPAIPSSKDG